MGLLDRIKLKRRERIVRTADGITHSAQRIPSGRSLIFSRGDYTLRNSELLFSAVSRIANSLSAMPIGLYQGSKAVKNELNDLISFAPNVNMTSCQFFKTMESCRGTAGNAYALKIEGEYGKLDHLDILDPGKVTPIINTDTGELWYRILLDTGKEIYVHNFYMVHVPFISTNGFSGISPVSVLQGTIDYGEEIKKFSANQLEKGVNAAVVLEAPANLSDPQRQTVVADFVKTYRETSGNILLLESGMTAKSLNLSPVDSKLFEVEKITRSKVAMVYNLPPHLLGDYSDTSFSSQEQQMLEFLMLTMLPIVTAYEQELDRKLLTSEQRRKGFHFKFNMDSILRADAATQAEVDYKAVRSAWKTPDEIRFERNLPPLPGGMGRKAMISQDLATLEYTVSEKPKVLAGKAERKAEGADEGSAASSPSTQESQGKALSVAAEPRHLSPRERQAISND